ncbi:MAG: lactonase family protein [Lactobacillales bacterium]|jgi:6-phosphogluconolactonase|nr:lactonase family protein [Lactobacillales bacterium]
MKEKILFGTYTKRISEGIYSMILDTELATLSGLQLVAKETNPTYLALDKENHLYSVGAENEEGGIAAFQFDGEKATLLNHVVSPGAPLCYVGVDEVRNLVYGSNYHLGEVRVYRRLADGSLEFADSVRHTGKGPDENQASPHVHFSNLTPDNRLVVCDLGNDGVYVYDVADNGKLTEVSVYQATPGAGSRHIVFHPNKKIAYLFGELNSTVEVLSYDAKTATFKQLQVISTIPSDHTTHNGGAAIRISADGKFLYASNRGHDSIVVYAVSENGEHLEVIQWISTEGIFPRDFNLSHSEEFVIAANQDSDNATLYRRDKENGTLTLLQKDVFIPEATCVYPI